MRPPTRPDLIERYERLKYPSRSEFEAKYELPQNFIGKLKMGAYSTRMSHAHIARLEGALAGEERARGLLPPPGPPVAPEPGPSALGRPRRADTLEGDDLDLLEELVEKIEASKDIAEVDTCGKMTTVALLRGVLTDATARIVKEMLAERRQSLNAKQEREEKAKAGNEMLIRVVFVRDWTGGPLPGEGPRS